MKSAAAPLKLSSQSMGNWNETDSAPRCRTSGGRSSISPVQRVTHITPSDPIISMNSSAA